MVNSTALLYNTNFSLLIMIMLSARCRDTTVNKVAWNFVKTHNEAHLMQQVAIHDILSNIKGINYYFKKSYAIKNISELIFLNKDWINRKFLLTLPSVSTKTTNVLLNLLNIEECIGVDTHVLYISNNIMGTYIKNTSIMEKNILNQLSKKYIKYINSLFVAVGKFVHRPICKIGQCIKCNILHMSHKIYINNEISI